MISRLEQRRGGLHSAPVYLTRCASCLGNQLSEMQRRVAKFFVEQDGHGMHQHLAQQAATQVPAVTRPHPFDVAPIDELAEDGVDAIAHARELRTPARV